MGFLRRDGMTSAVFCPGDHKTALRLAPDAQREAYGFDDHRTPRDNFTIPGASDHARFNARRPFCPGATRKMEGGVLRVAPPSHS